MDKELIKEALNELGSALSDHKHKWTNEQRGLYDKAMNELNKNN